jgi:putative hemolysin
MLIGNNLALFVATGVVTDFYLARGMEGVRLLFGFIPWSAEMAATLSLIFPMFFLAELWPKNLFRQRADALMYRLAGLLRLIVLLFLPITWLLEQLFRFLTHGADSAASRDLHRLSPDALREYFSAGKKDGVISHQQDRMLDNVTSMHRTSIRSLMTPFNQVPHCEPKATVADLKQLIQLYRTPYAVVVHHHSVVGYVSLFSVVSRKLVEKEHLKPCVEDVLVLPEGRNLKSAFYRLRRNPRHCAVVVDARRHPVGFIRLEDIARYIVHK